MNDTTRPADVTVTDTTIIIDNRTPEEYADGHVEGALNIDYNGGEVEPALPNLDPDAHYLVYCRSGGRSGKAMELMQQAGITSVVNLGGLEDAAAAVARPIVTD